MIKLPRNLLPDLFNDIEYLRTSKYDVYLLQRPDPWQRIFLLDEIDQSAVREFRRRVALEMFQCRDRVHALCIWGGEPRKEFIRNHFIPIPAVFEYRRPIGRPEKRTPSNRNAGQAGHVAEILDVMALGEESRFRGEPFQRGDSGEKVIERTVRPTFS